MLLFDHPLSSYAQKVKIALREKGLRFDTELPEHFGTGRADTPFAAASPRTEVPVLFDGEARIFDSTIILAYLEEKWPEPALLPPSPEARAKARMIEEICDTQYEAVNWGFGELLWFKRATGELKDQLEAEAKRHTAQLQAWLAEQLGGQDWFGGRQFGWADICVAPMLNRSVYYGLGPIAGSPLAAWHRRVCARPPVADTFLEFDTAAARMAAASELYTTGGRRREYRDHHLEWMVKAGGIDVVRAGLRDRNIRFPWPNRD